MRFLWREGYYFFWRGETFPRQTIGLEVVSSVGAAGMLVVSISGKILELCIDDINSIVSVNKVAWMRICVFCGREHLSSLPFPFLWGLGFSRLYAFGVESKVF